MAKTESVIRINNENENKVFSTLTFVCTLCFYIGPMVLGKTRTVTKFRIKWPLIAENTCVNTTSIKNWLYQVKGRMKAEEEMDIIGDCIRNDMNKRGVSAEKTADSSE